MVHYSKKIPLEILKHIFSVYEAEICATERLAGRFTIALCGNGSSPPADAFVRDVIDRRYALLESDRFVGFLLAPLN